MNILHMKYAVEVARAGSLSKAAEALIMAQPNLSRAIKELEADLGIKIFDRSAKGMRLTPDGEQFIGYAKEILQQIESLESLYQTPAVKRQRFSISVPRAGYISEGFTQFTKLLRDGPFEVFYKETNTTRTLRNVQSGEYQLGIIRYPDNHDQYFKTMLEDKALHYELITEFSYQLLMSQHHPLAQRDNITLADLSDYIEIAHADPYIPSLALSKPVKEEIPDNVRRKIFIFERASQYDLLSENHETFMWVSPAPEQALQRYGLVQKPCAENKRTYRDMLIYQHGYHLTTLDKQFVTELCNVRRKYLK